jgi:hypothetical protein
MLTALCIVWLVGCRKEPPEPNDPIQAFQRYYRNTRWYFTKSTWIPSADERFEVDSAISSTQVFISFPSGSRVIYTEYVPSRSGKSFTGKGTLIKIPNCERPIFRKQSSYTRENPDKILLVGFVGSRRFQVEANWNKNEEELFSEALLIATKAYDFLISETNIEQSD